MTETTEKAILAGRLLLGNAGPAAQAARRHLDARWLHRRRRPQRDLSPPRHARRGDRDRLRPPADLPRTRVLARTPTQLTLLRLGDLDRLTSHDPNVRRGYDNSSSPRRTYFREPVLVDEHVSPTRKEPRQSARSELMATFVEQVRRGTAQHQVEFQLSVSMGARWPVGRRVTSHAALHAVPQPKVPRSCKKR
jgi:hypothetical protein